MAFCFKRKESIARAIPRLGSERVKHALECLADCSKPESIHGTRKEIKKARAVLQLARTNISDKEYRRIAKRLRKAAAHLAKPRDAAVKARTLRDLARNFKRRLASDAFREVRVHLRRASDKAMDSFLAKEKTKLVDGILHAAAKDFRVLEIDANGWEALAPGVKMAYRDCRRAYKCVLKNPSPDNLHEWRKSAKNLWYQMLLLQPIWPEQIDRMACELETVGDYLGDDHDLFILQQSLQDRRAVNGDAKELQALRKLIEERQRELREKALAVGKYFYAEKPSAFCNRLAGYWRSWQRKKDLSVRSARSSRNK